MQELKESQIRERDLFPLVDRMPLFWANLLSDKKIVVNQGGTYSGKTQSIMRVLIFYAIFYKGLKIEVAGATYPKLEADSMEIMIDQWDNNPALRRFKKKWNQSKHTFYFKNGSRIIFKSYEKAKDADGPKRDILYISEARNLSWPVAYQLIKRTHKKVFLDYNPVAEFWCHDKIINCQPSKSGRKEFPSVEVIRSWHEHNFFIPKEKHEEIEDIADPELWKAYARGLTAKVTGLVFPNFMEIRDWPEARNEDIIWGLDLGYTNDPTALVKCALNQTINGVFYDYVFQEITYTPGLPAGMLFQLMQKHGYKEGQPLYMEHDKGMQRDLRALRIQAIRAQKGPGSVYSGILHLRTKRVAFIGENIRTEKRRYSFIENDDGTPSNDPEDMNNHTMDAIRYAAYTHSVRHGLIKGEKMEDQEALAEAQTV